MKDVKDFKIGERVRSLRESQKMPLEKLARETGLSPTVLDQIEQDIVAPPISTLLSIAKVLGVDINYFFAELRSAGDLEIVRANERRSIKRKPAGKTALTYSYQTLAYRMADKKMEPFLVEFDINIEEEVPMMSHDGEEFIFVLEGEVEFRSERETVVLRHGDSIYFRSRIPHAFKGIGQVKPKAVAVIYSPKEKSK